MTDGPDETPGFRSGPRTDDTRNRSWRGQMMVGSQSSRGQMMVVASLLVAGLVLGMAAFLGSGISVGTMATDATNGDAVDASGAYQETERTVGHARRHANANHASSHDALARNFTGTVRTTGRALADAYAKNGAAYATSTLSVTDRTAIVQDNATRNLSDATGATAWTLVDGVDDTQTFEMTVDREGLAGPNAPDRFRLTVTNGSVTWELRLAHDQDTGDVKLEVTTPSGSNTCQEKNETASFDLAAGTLAGEDCRDLAAGDVVDGPHAVSYGNADNATGEYELTVTGATGVSESSYETGTASPRANYSISSATVHHSYESTAVSHEANVTVP